MADSTQLSSSEVGFRIDRWIKEAVDAWFVKQCKNPYERFYLFYKKDFEGLAILSESEEGPEWILASNERISPGWEKGRAFIRCKEISRGLPML